MKSITINGQNLEVTDEQFEVITSPLDNKKSIQTMKEIGAKGKVTNGKILSRGEQEFEEIQYLTYEIEYDGKLQISIVEWSEL